VERREEIRKEGRKEGMGPRKYPFRLGDGKGLKHT
jgi:hypothetical protein